MRQSLRSILCLLLIALQCVTALVAARGAVICHDPDGRVHVEVLADNGHCHDGPASDASVMLDAGCFDTPLQSIDPAVRGRESDWAGLCIAARALAADPLLSWIITPADRCVPVEHTAAPNVHPWRAIRSVVLII